MPRQTPPNRQACYHVDSTPANGRYSISKHAKSSYVFTEKDLWGADGRPGGTDIDQKRLGDCFLVAAAESVAQQTPDVIRCGIRYDAQTGSFSVRLFKDGQWTSVSVTQAELHQTLKTKAAVGSAS